MELMQRKLRYDDKTSFHLYHLCYYFSRIAGSDEDKKLVLDFKKGKESAIRHLIISALNFLENYGFEESTLIVRALNSNETSPWDLTPLDRLGDSLATVFDCSYYPNIISKARTTTPMKTLDLLRRASELKNVYQIDANVFNLNERSVLIIDDVVTTGATACAIIKPILHAFPGANINVFALAWTPSPNQQEYILQRRENYLVASEPEVAYGLENKEWIDKDFEEQVTNISVYPLSDKRC